MLVGSGANGKSVLLSVVTALLGRANVTAVQPSQFDNKFQRAHLHGKLANIVTEIKEGAELPDDVLKGIVSGELTTAEHKLKPPFDFEPFVTCWFGTNHMPHSRDFSDALFRRAIVVTFNRKFYGEDRDPKLKDKLLEELPGILNMSLSGIADVFLNDFIEPASCITAKKEWRLQCDQVGRFVEDCCEKVPGHFEESGYLFDLYRNWASSEGIMKPIAKNGLSTRLSAQGFVVGHNADKTKRGIHGIRIKDDIPC
jgi:putative DNA primase/helicase